MSDDGTHNVAPTFGALRSAYDDWTDGNAYTDEHYIVDPAKFVGRVPAGVHKTAEQLMAAFIPLAIDLIDSLADVGDCEFDHHGGCQAHGYLGLEPGEECPQHTARRLIEAWNEVGQ